MVCLCVCTYAYHAHSGAHRGQKRTLDPIELELNITVTCHISAENKIWFLCKSSKCF